MIEHYNPVDTFWRGYFGAVSPRHQFVNRSAHPGSKPNKPAKARQQRAKAKRHCRNCPEERGRRHKAKGGRR